MSDEEDVNDVFASFFGRTKELTGDLKKLERIMTREGLKKDKLLKKLEILQGHIKKLQDDAEDLHKKLSGDI